MGGLALDRQGALYVTDGKLPGIRKISPSGQSLASWRLEGVQPGRNGFPVTVDGRGNVYVGVGDTIMVYSSGGEPRGKWSGGAGVEALREVSGLAADKDDNLYVTEFCLNRVRKLSPDGRTVWIAGRAGSHPGEFLGPTGVAVDRQGYVYVGEDEGARVQRLVPRQ